MSKAKKIIIISSIVAVIGVASFFILKKLTAKSDLMRMLEDDEFNNAYDDSPYRIKKGTTKQEVSMNPSQYGDKKTGYGYYNEFLDGKGDYLKYIDSYYQKNVPSYIKPEDVEFVRAYMTFYEGGLGKVTFQRKIRDEYASSNYNNFKYNYRPLRNNIVIEFTDGRRRGKKITANSYKQLLEKVFQAPYVHLGEDGKWIT